METLCWQHVNIMFALIALQRAGNTITCMVDLDNLDERKWKGAQRSFADSEIYLREKEGREVMVGMATGLLGILD